MRCINNFFVAVVDKLFLLVPLYIIISNNFLFGQNFHEDIFYTNYLCGEWKIYKYIFGDISDWGEDESNRYLGTKIVFTKNEILFFDEKGMEPSYKFSSMNPTDLEFYLKDNYGMNSKELRINQESIMFCVINCKIKLSNDKFLELPIDVFILNDGEIIFPHKGNFFFLHKS